MPKSKSVSIKSLTNESVRKENNTGVRQSYLIVDLAGCDVVCLGVSGNSKVEACAYCNIFIAPCDDKLKIKDCSDPVDRMYYQWIYDRYFHIWVVLVTEDDLKSFLDILLRFIKEFFHAFNQQ